MSDAKVFLDARSILALPDMETEEVYIKQWGTFVRVRAMTGAERDAWEASMMTGKGKNREVNTQNIRAKLVARTVVNEDGTRMFDDLQVKALGQKSAAAIDTIYDVAARLSGISDDDVDELGKPSSSGQSGDSTSD